VTVILPWLAGAIGVSDAANAHVATISENNRHGFISSWLTIKVSDECRWRDLLRPQEA